MPKRTALSVFLDFSDFFLPGTSSSAKSVLLDFFTCSCILIPSGVTIPANDLTVGLMLVSTLVSLLSWVVALF